MPTNPCKSLIPHESLTPQRTPYPLGPLNLRGSLIANGILNANGSIKPHSSQNSNGPLNPPRDPLKPHGSLKPHESLKPLIPWIVMSLWSPVCPWIQNWLLNPHATIESATTFLEKWFEKSGSRKVVDQKKKVVLYHKSTFFQVGEKWLTRKKNPSLQNHFSRTTFLHFPRKVVAD